MNPPYFENKIMKKHREEERYAYFCRKKQPAVDDA